MWVSGEWSESFCNATIPELDEETSQHKVVCMCISLGVIGYVFVNFTHPCL